MEEPTSRKIQEEASRLCDLANDGNIEEMKKIINKSNCNAKSPKHCQPPLICAARNEGSNAPAMVKLVLSKGADVNKRDLYGNTALHHAARRHNVRVAEILIEAGATVDARNDEKETPLFSAAKSQLRQEPVTAMVKLLLKKGADPLALDRYTIPLLYYAKQYPQKPAADLLEAAMLQKLAQMGYRNDKEIDRKMGDLLKTDYKRGAK